eukprot:CAMPEP_0179442182 /NCGR_PEP_ID=MMETSP0799-20121207/25673_1 /TAXON_ID=46947 /ORGANISM="Geminigera cryophila, Strain CCMP2564" /LENGTH=204 /DNA_ID=CAMNT_0021227059 /DNA_START=391 /DNA_END=1005 /DNA_ORIENTATION=+
MSLAAKSTDKAPLAAKSTVKAPAQTFGVSGRYANALWQHANKVGILEAVEQDLSTVTEALQTNVNFAKFVGDPCISRKKKNESMALAMASADETTRKLVAVLCENGRLNMITEVIKDFSTLMRAHRKQIVVTITSAIKLDVEDMSLVTDALANFKKEGESFVISEKVNPALLGGFAVQLGDKYVDLSTLKRIREIERLLQEPVY